MEHTNGTGGPNGHANGRVSSRSAENERRSPTTPRQDAHDVALGDTTAASHAIMARMRILDSVLEQNNADQAAFFTNHVAQFRAVIAAALDLAIQGERLRLASVLYDDLVELLCAARMRLSVVVEANTDAPIGDALRGIDECLSGAVRATRGIVTDLAPNLDRMWRRRIIDRSERERRAITAEGGGFGPTLTEAVKMAEAASTAAPPSPGQAGAGRSCATSQPDREPTPRRAGGGTAARPAGPVHLSHRPGA